MLRFQARAGLQLLIARDLAPVFGYRKHKIHCHTFYCMDTIMA
jgi:hypothetical protein